jgi:hypothetical protein
MNQRVDQKRVTAAAFTEHVHDPGLDDVCRGFDDRLTALRRPWRRSPPARADQVLRRFAERTRMAHMSGRRSGAFWPVRRPLFQGSRK